MLLIAAKQKQFIYDEIIFIMVAIIKKGMDFKSMPLYFIWLPYQ